MLIVYHSCRQPGRHETRNTVTVCLALYSLNLTATGRRWDGHLYNVRDKATKENPITNPQFLKLQYHTTSDIIRAVNEETFPNQAMLNFHPQRWNDAFVPWVKELVWQNVKNQGKCLLKAVRSER